MSGFLIMLLGVALAVQAAPVAAQAPPVAVAPDLAIPFDPPIGETLAYRFTRTQSRNDVPHSTSLDMRVRFSRDGDAYLMTVTYIVPPGLPQGTPGLAILLRPLTVRLAADGALLGLADEAGYWDASDRAVDEMMRHMPSANARVRQAVRESIEALRALPADERLALITENFSAIVEFAGRTMPLGEQPETVQDRASLLGPLTQRTRASLALTGDGRAQVITTTSIPAEQLNRGGTAFLGRIAPERLAAQPLRITGLEERNTYRIALRSGLVEHWEARQILHSMRGDAPHRTEKSTLLVRLPSP